MVTKKTPRRARRRSASPAAEGQPPAPPQPDAEQETQATPIPDCPSEHNLYQRIIFVRENLPKTIKKDQGGGLNYQVLSHESINVFLKPLLNKAGLVDSISETWQSTVDSGKKQGSKNLPVLYVKGWYTYRVTNAVKPEQFIEIKVSGWGEDTGDKGPGKAQTYAFKAGRTKIFSIAAGENEEGRIPDSELSDGKPLLTAEQFSALLEKADELFGDDSDEMMKLMCEKLFGGAEPLKIPADMFPIAIEALEKKKAAVDKRTGTDGEDVAP